MERKEFLKRLGMSSLMVPIIASCTTDGDPSVVPIITEFSPSTGPVGTTVTITGINFNAAISGNTVYFNGTTATVTEATSTQLVVTVPTGATTGKVSISANETTVTSGSDFTVTTSSSSLSITSFTSSAAIGSSITIVGTNFSTTTSENTVTINGVAAVVTAATATNLTVTIPASAESGLIAVTVAGVTVTSTSSFTVASATSCATTNSETEGPFPTKSPSTLVMTDIRSDRTGIAFNMKITITNKNNGCLALEGVMVDVWHCDKDGNYSEYGGTNMQSVNYTTVHFLRGRQTTDAIGQVGFNTIFPGWYSGRATHVHVHIYDATGKSLLVTQIAFPEGSGSAVALVNASTENGYTKGMSGYTYNSSDNVFSDGVANELASVSGTVADGFELTHTIVVSG